MISTLDILLNSLEEACKTDCPISSTVLYSILIEKSKLKIDFNVFITSLSLLISNKVIKGYEIIKSKDIEIKKTTSQ